MGGPVTMPASAGGSCIMTNVFAPVKGSFSPAVLQRLVAVTAGYTND
jgi:hypothetical protein